MTKTQQALIGIGLIAYANPGVYPATLATAIAIIVGEKKTE